MLNRIYIVISDLINMPMSYVVKHYTIDELCKYMSSTYNANEMSKVYSAQRLSSAYKFDKIFKLYKI